MKKTLVFSCCMILGLMLLAGCTTSKGAAEATTQGETVDTSKAYTELFNEDGTLKDVKAEDYVTVCDYDPITLKKSDVNVEDAEVDAQISQIMSQYTKTEQVKDRAVKKNDTVNIDFTGKVDGKEFDGGTAKGYDLVIGSGSFIDDFEDQLVGVKPGESKTVKVTFPEDYQAENLKGKDAEFDVKVNYIAVQKEQELTDDFVKENLKDQYSSVKDMKEKIKDNLKTQKEKTAVQTYIHDNSKFKEIPKDLVEKVFDAELNMVKAQVASSGGSYDDYIKSMGFESEDALKEAYFSNMEDTVKMHLIFDVIAAKEKIKSSEEDIKKMINPSEYEQYIKIYSENYLNRMALNNKVLDFLCENIKTK